MKTYTVDQYGVKNYHTSYLLMVGVVVTVVVIGSFAGIVLGFESADDSANIRSYGDAIWLMAMAASTIGFGDFYPVTLGGRIVTFVMFALGIGLMGFIGATIAGRLLGWSDTNVKNRELRAQNAAILGKVDLLLSQIGDMKDEIEHISDYVQDAYHAGFDLSDDGSFDDGDSDDPRGVDDFIDFDDDVPFGPLDGGREVRGVQELQQELQQTEVVQQTQAGSEAQADPLAEAAG